MLRADETQGLSCLEEDAEPRHTQIRRLELSAFWLLSVLGPLGGAAVAFFADYSIFGSVMAQPYTSIAVVMLTLAPPLAVMWWRGAKHVFQSTRHANTRS